MAFSPRSLHEVFISPISCLISGSAIYVPDTSRSLLIRRIWSRANSSHRLKASLHSLVFRWRSHISFFFEFIWLIFARFNLHWALSNRLSYRKEMRKMTFAELFLHHLGHNPIGQGRFRDLLLRASVKRNMYKSNKWLPLYRLQVCCVGRACSWSRSVNYDLGAKNILVSISKQL